MLPSNTIAAIFIRPCHAARVNTSKANAKPTQRYNGLTRNQHAMPSERPAPNANHTFVRCAASINNQTPATTNHVVGASADGYAPYNANSGESANTKLAAIAARLPNALHAIPVRSEKRRVGEEGRSR